MALIGILAICAVMVWGSYKIEPHWVSRDGRRVICYGQGMSRRGATYGRWREVRVTSIGEGLVEVRPRRGSLAADRYADTPATPGLMGFGGGGRRASKVSRWRVSGTPPQISGRRVIFQLNNTGGSALPDMVVIRLPAKSRAIPMLEELAKYTADTEASAPSDAD